MKNSKFGTFQFSVITNSGFPYTLSVQTSFQRPDGSVTQDKPSQGEYFYKQNQDGDVEGYIWDDMFMDWLIVPEPTFTEECDAEVRMDLFSRCECGSEKAGTGGHSSWCPKNDNR